MTELLASPWVSGLSLVLGMAGVVLAIVFYYRSLRDRGPSFARVSHSVLDVENHNNDALKVFYNGAHQTRVTISYIAFWNSGRLTIDASDVPSERKLGFLVAHGATVLDARVVATTDLGDHVELQPHVVYETGATLVPFVFRYFDKNEGFVVQITHNGPRDHAIIVSGRVKGAKRIRSVFPDTLSDEMQRQKKLVDAKTRSTPPSPGPAWIVALIGMSLMGVSLGALISGDLDWYMWLILTLAALLTFGGLSDLATSRAIPKQLRAHLRPDQLK